MKSYINGIGIQQFTGSSSFPSNLNITLYK
jgi:hypothetical protein